MLTPDKLKSLIVRRSELGKEEAGAIADAVLSYFGYGTVIIDNAIESEDRKWFYRLQDYGLLKSTWETVLLPSGKEWRIFYWELSGNGGEKPKHRQDEATLVYDTLPDEAWGRAGEIG